MCSKKSKRKRLERFESKKKLLWSISLPGLGQLLNEKYFKGIIFISLEFLINGQSHFNELILFSFNGEIESAIDKTDYQWLMYYPCVYFLQCGIHLKMQVEVKNLIRSYPFFYVHFSLWAICIQQK